MTIIQTFRGSAARPGGDPRLGLARPWNPAGPPAAAPWHAGRPQRPRDGRAPARPGPLPASGMAGSGGSGGSGALDGGGGGPPAARPGSRLPSAPPPASAGGAGGRGRDAHGTAGEGHPRPNGAAPRRPPVCGGGPGSAAAPFPALSVARAETYRGRQPVQLASGFFYENRDKIYYITCWHVVTGSGARRPNTIKLNLHTDLADMESTKTVSIGLRSALGCRLWKEHPHYRGNADVAAIPVSRDLLDGCEVVPLSKNDLVPSETTLDLGQDLVVVGFPARLLSDLAQNLPTALNASLASPHMVPFDGKPHVVVSAKLHPGMSGSPVLTKPIFNAGQTDGTLAASPGGAMYLVGIHSAEAFAGPDNDLDKSKPLNLNRCWFASLLDDMT